MRWRRYTLPTRPLSKIRARRASSTGGQYTTGNAPACVTRRIGLVVIRLSMDHDGGAICVQDRIGPTAQGRAGDHELHSPSPIRSSGQVWHVSHMHARGVIPAMLARGWIPMAARAGEVGRRACSGHVDMDRMNTRRESTCLHIDMQAVRRFRHLRFAPSRPVCGQQDSAGIWHPGRPGIHSATVPARAGSQAKCEGCKDD